MLPNLFLGYAFYDMAVSVQAFLTNATNLNKIQMQSRVCPKTHEDTLHYSPGGGLEVVAATD